MKKQRIRNEKEIALNRHYFSANASTTSLVDLLDELGKALFYRLCLISVLGIAFSMIIFINLIAFAMLVNGDTSHVNLLKWLCL